MEPVSEFFCHGNTTYEWKGDTLNLEREPAKQEILFLSYLPVIAIRGSHGLIKGCVVCSDVASLFCLSLSLTACSSPFSVAWLQRKIG